MGILMAWLAFACCVAALFSPAWTSAQGSGNCDPRVGSGIFLTCICPYDDNRDCSFFGAADGADWQLACQVLWPIATGFLLFCSIAAIFMCCDWCRNAYWPSTLAVLCFLAFGCSIATIVVYGVKMTDTLNKDADELFDRDEPYFFDWGMYLAIAGSGLSLIAFILFDLAICCIRKD
jgi:hypothetical protein